MEVAGLIGMILWFQFKWSISMSVAKETQKMLVYKTLGPCRLYCQNSSVKQLDRKWMLPRPDAQIHKILLLETARQMQCESVSSRFSFSIDQDPTLGRVPKMHIGEDGLFFYVIRDDLLHPLVNGNKARKLDALLPVLQQFAATDIVTCGGCQSAHAAAMAVACAEIGIKPHLLLRGEQPEVPTGYNLISLMYGNTTYIARSLYSKREDMLLQYASSLAGNTGSVHWMDDILENIENIRPQNVESGIAEESRILMAQAEAHGNDSSKVVIIKEGAASVMALLGLIRLVNHLSETLVFGTEQEIELVLDAGTGTTAIGLAIGARIFGLPWRITAVMLADTTDGYRQQEKHLLSEFKKFCQLESFRDDEDIVHWVERKRPRKFGKVLEGEIAACQQIARETGILVDPIYTLAAWEQATQLRREAAGRHAKVVMLHTGGTLAMFGLAQRFASHFLRTETR